MQNEKKAKTAPGATEPKERIYTEPGVYGLAEEPSNGLKKAVLVYHADQPQMLEIFKHFNYFLANTDILNLHIEMAAMFTRLLILAKEEDEDYDFFESVDQQLYFRSLLDFTGKLASEEAHELKEKLLTKRAEKIFSTSHKIN